MFKIKVDFQEIYIKPSESIRLEVPSGYFDSSAIPSARILPFNVPVQGNEEIFDYLHLSYQYKTIKKLDCQILFYEVPLMTGKLYVTKTSAFSYRCSIIVNGFSEEFNNQNLVDLEFDPIVISLTSPDHYAVVNHATDVANGEEAPYRFPLVAAEKFYGTVDETEDTSENNASYGQQEIDISGRFYNLINPVTFNYWNNSIGEDGSTNNWASLVPFFQLNWVLEKILESQNYQLSGSFVQSEAIQKLLMMNNRTLDKKYSMYQAQARRNAETLDDSVVKFILDRVDPENCYNVYTGKYTAAEDGIHEVSFTIEHKAQALEVLQRNARVWFSIYKNGSAKLVEYSRYSSPDAYKTNKFTFTTLIDAGETLEIRAIGSVEEDDGFGNWPTSYQEIYLQQGLVNYRNISYTTLNQYETSIYPARHLPDLTVSKLFTSIKQMFGLVFLFDTKKKVAEIEFFDTILKGKSLDITQIMIENSLEEEYQIDEGYELQFKADGIKDISGFDYIGEVILKSDLPIPAELEQCALVITENAYYVYQIDESDDFQLPYWKFYSDRLENKAEGQESTQLSPSAAPAAMTMLDRYLVPRYDDEASSPSFGLEVSPMDLRLLFDYGLITINEPLTDTDYVYPFASSQNYDVEGNNMGNMNLNWDELYENFLQNQLHYMAKGIKATCRIGVNFESMLRLLSLVMPKVSNPNNYRFVTINQKKYLPETMTFIISGQQIKDAELKMRRRMDD